MPDKVAIGDADVMDGYVPSDEDERRELWENEIYQTLIDKENRL